MAPYLRVIQTLKRGAEFVSVTVILPRAYIKHPHVLCLRRALLVPNKDDRKQVVIFSLGAKNILSLRRKRDEERLKKDCSLRMRLINGMKKRD